MSVLWDFFDTFLPLRAGGPGRPFGRLFGDFVETPVYGGSHRNASDLKSQRPPAESTPKSPLILKIVLAAPNPPY